MSLEGIGPQVRRLDAGTLYLPPQIYIAGASPLDKPGPFSPSMAWLITHPVHGHILFDLGLNKDLSTYPPRARESLETFLIADVPVDIFDSLKAKGVDPDDIKLIILSHFHYDHTGIPKRFKNAKVLVGPGAMTLMHPDVAYPKNPDSEIDADLFLPGQASELPAPETNPLRDDGQPFWQQVGPFPEAHQLFSENWIYIVNAPGHMLGHLNLFLRVSSNKWVLLAGDTCHDVAILNGTAEIAMFPDPATGRTRCAHHDKELAELHIKRVREFQEMGVEVILAHDRIWLEQNADRFQ